MKGDFKLKFDNPININGFYEQIENNLKSLISKDGHYTLNKFSGVLSVYDRKKYIENIEKMINQIKSRSKQQILIEAKILEVVLNNNHALGISWEAVADSVFKAGDQLLLRQTLGLAGAVAGTMTYTTENFSAVITALDESGDVDTLSNPRIKVLSGQSAIISSCKLVPFWEKEVQTNQGTGGSASNTEVTYNRRDVLHGVTMGVTPMIMEDGKIMLNIIPITSSIEDVIEHYDEEGNSVASAPILNVKEAGTVIFAKDNDLVLIGGLINNTVKKTQEKIPLLGDIPWLGQLFKKTVDKDEKRELVILLKLNVVH
jgi:MSHA biogenesis protein MshL